MSATTQPPLEGTDGQREPRTNRGSVTTRLLDLLEVYSERWWRRSELINEYNRRWEGTPRSTLDRSIQRLIDRGLVQTSTKGMRARSGRLGFEDLPDDPAELEALIEELSEQVYGTG